MTGKIATNKNKGTEREERIVAEVLVRAEGERELWISSTNAKWNSPTNIRTLVNKRVKGAIIKIVFFFLLFFLCLFYFLAIIF